MTIFSRPSADVAELLRQQYRWYTIFGWWTRDSVGLKLGPMTACVYWADRWEVCVFALGWLELVDTGLARWRSR